MSNNEQADVADADQIGKGVAKLVLERAIFVSDVAMNGQQNGGGEADGTCRVRVDGAESVIAVEVKWSTACGYQRKHDIKFQWSVNHLRPWEYDVALCFGTYQLRDNTKHPSVFARYKAALLHALTRKKLINQDASLSAVAKYDTLETLKDRVVCFILPNTYRGAGEPYALATDISFRPTIVADHRPGTKYWDWCVDAWDVRAFNAMLKKAIRESRTRGRCPVPKKLPETPSGLVKLLHEALAAKEAAEAKLAEAKEPAEAKLAEAVLCQRRTHEMLENARSNYEKHIPAGPGEADSAESRYRSHVRQAENLARASAYNNETIEESQDDTTA